MVGPKSNQILLHCSPFLLKISCCCCVPILFHLMLTSTSANIMPVTGYHGLLADMQSCFKYTCIRLTPPPIVTYTSRSKKMKWQPGEGSSFLQIYSLSFPQSLSNLFWFLFCFPKKKKKNPISKHPYPSIILTPGENQAGWLILKASPTLSCGC